MNDDSMFDPVETELQRRFDALDAEPEDPDAVLDAMRPRLRRAQRNHRLTNAAAAVGAIVVAVVIVLAAFGSGDGGSVRTPPANHTPNVPTTVTSPDPGTGPTGATPQPNDATSQAGETESPGPQTTSPSSESPPPVTTPDSAPLPTTVPANEDMPYSSPGGSIVVHRLGSTISLGSSTPAAGFSQEIHDNGPSRVEVRFKNEQTEWRIRVDLVDGALEAETTQH